MGETETFTEERRHCDGCQDDLKKSWRGHRGVRKEHGWAAHAKVLKQELRVCWTGW